MRAVFHLGKINSYKPIVSDVSDDDLMETVKQIKKSENVIVPTPGLTRTMPFDIFKMTRGRWSCSIRKSVKSPQIYQFNPIRSSAAMTELSKKRWVSPISAVLMFLFATPPKLISFVHWQLCRKQFLIDISVSRILPRQRSNGLLVHTTGGGPSGQKFSTKGTLPRSPITTGKLNLLMQVPKMWMNCKLTFVTS